MGNLIKIKIVLDTMYKALTLASVATAVSAGGYGY